MTVEHWQTAYETQDQHSWDQRVPAMDLAMLRDAGLMPTDSVLDVGGGDGAFAQALLERGHRDVTVLDIASRALAAGRRRLEDGSTLVDWITADARTWMPSRTWQVWHDRAAFHFLTAARDRTGYRRALAAATRPGALVCVGTFAENGPTHCSGLAVNRYNVDHLAEELRRDGLELDSVAEGNEVHTTPRGSAQPFTWVLLRRRS